MTVKDTIPKKKAASERSKGKSKVPKKDMKSPQEAAPKVPKKDRKSPPEAAACKRNMDSDCGSEYKSEDEPGQDKSLEEAQHGVPFGKKRPKFDELKSAEEGKEEKKEDGEYEEPSALDAGIFPPKDYLAYKKANIDKYHAAKAKQHIRAFVEEIARKPIQRDPKGKAFGTGSF